MSAKNTKVNFKKGAASFYIVAFSTLILVIIAASFAAIIVSEIARTSNDDLSQSAYDSALAGVEDAKLAFYNYQKCQGDDAPAGCEDIKNFVENSGEDKKCDMVANILGRTVEGEDHDDGVLVQETSKGDSSMMQAYTCVYINTTPVDYRGELSSGAPVKVVKGKFANGVPADSINKMKISWFSLDDADSAFGDKGSLQYIELNPTNNGGIFDSKTTAVPTIALGMIQTSGSSFSLNSFDVTKNSQTNRGMIYLVPTRGGSDSVYNEEGENYINAYDSEIKKNYVQNKLIGGSNGGFLKSNDKTTRNLPYIVDCADEVKDGEEFMCSAIVDLPKPVGESPRNDDTFMFIVSLPYGPSTEFALEFYCSDLDCKGEPVADDDSEKVVRLDNGQVVIDSTGRANDLYRRVEVRLEPESAVDPYAFYGIQLWGDDEESNLMKNLAPTSEWNFK